MSSTPVYGFKQPAINDGLTQQWGQHLNENWQGVENALLASKASVVLVPAGFAPTVNVDQFGASGNVIQIVPAGSNTGTITIIMPDGPKDVFVLFNETTQDCLIQSETGSNVWTLRSATSAAFVQNALDIFQVTPSPVITINGATMLSNPVAIDISGNGISVADLGGGGGPTQLQFNLQVASGQNLFPIPPLLGNNGVTSLRNKTLWLYIPTGAGIASLNPQTTSAAFAALVKSGQLNIGHSFFYKTIDSLDMHVAVKTQILWQGSPGIVIDATGGQVTQPSDNFQAQALGNSFDCYVGIYFANDVVNDTVQIGVATSGAIVCPSLLVAGDGTSVGVGGLINGGSPINDFTKHYLMPWFEIG